MHKMTCAIVLGVLLVLSVEGSYGEWKRMPRPGSDIRSLAFNGSTLFAAGSKNRMYRTTNSGQIWTQVNLIGTRAVPNRAYNVLVLYPECALLGTSTGSIYRGKSDGSDWSTAATSDTDAILAFAGSRGKTSVRFMAGGFGNGIRVSNDSGKTWTSSTAGLANLKVTALGSGRSLPDSSGQVVYAATYGGGVFVSPDNGQTWSPTGQSSPVSNVTAIHVDGDQLVAGGTDEKVCRSSDGGNSWQDVSANLSDSDVLCLTIMIDTTDEWIYCGTADAGVWRCRSSGGQWTPCNTGLTNPGINTIIPDDGALYIGTNEGVYRSS
ncbi:MAG TPA: YCF48-related protein, partial [Bacteroidota bacterium]|nr:YCF48-related protein [Bacteroidota bacterium]